MCLFLTVVFCQDDESNADKNDALSTEVDETQSHMLPALVPETINLTPGLVLPPGESV